MSVRLEDIHAETSSNYMSFLEHNPNIRSSDHGSIHSIATMRGVMSKMSSLLTTLGLNPHKEAREARRKAAQLQNIRYLFSSFTKLPCLRLVHNRTSKLIANFEEFPFDTAVPLHTFKNLTVLEICDVDFRSIFGWDRLSDSLRSLTLKRAKLENIRDLIFGIVLDDADQRRKRSCKTPPSPRLGNAMLSSSSRSKDFPRFGSDLERTSTFIPQGPNEDSTSGGSLTMHGRKSASPEPLPLARSDSGLSWCGRCPPEHPSSEDSGGRARRGSIGSERPILPFSTPRRSTNNLLPFSFDFASKWAYLRHLSLPYNALTDLDAPGLAPLVETLYSLDLSNNYFAEIPEALADMKALSQLNMSNCRVKTLRSLVTSSPPALAVLNLRTNQLTTLSGIECLKTLERVDLRDNQLNDSAELIHLTSLRCFHDVYVRGNPLVSTHQEHRVAIFNLFREHSGLESDITIDASGPEQDEVKHLVSRAAKRPKTPQPVASKQQQSVSETHGNEEANEAEEDAPVKQIANPTSNAETGATSYVSDQNTTRAETLYNLQTTSTGHSAVPKPIAVANIGIPLSA